ncbi:hypothetical protein ACFWGD_04435 [Corynebacterium sp. NPDC060344]|uniref:hypothetical protein n=1 Tax=Corynebacterium sp. NPDC060344 TaxID=3347101 RepID=UPI00365FB6B0
MSGVGRRSRVAVRSAAIALAVGLGAGLVGCGDGGDGGASQSTGAAEASPVARPDLPGTGQPVVDMCSEDVMGRMTGAGYQLRTRDDAAGWCDFEDPETGRLALLMNDPALQYDVIAAESDPKPARETVAPDAPESVWVVRDVLVTTFSQCLAGETAQDGMQYVLVTEHGAAADSCASAVEAYRTAIG